METEATVRPTGLLEQQLRAHGGTLLVWLTVLVVHGLVLLALAPSRSSHAPPGKRMQLFWISIENGAVEDAVPQQRSAEATSDEATAANADASGATPRATPAPRMVDGSRTEAPLPSVKPTAGPEATLGQRGPATPDILGKRFGIDALLPQLPALAQPVPLRTAPLRFDGGRGRIRLPGSDATRVPGLVVRDAVSLDQRVQGVLALVGWGRIDPCPDIRRHVRSAIEARDPNEVSYWSDREQRCR